MQTRHTTEPAGWTSGATSRRTCRATTQPRRNCARTAPPSPQRPAPRYNFALPENKTLLSGRHASGHASRTNRRVQAKHQTHPPPHLHEPSTLPTRNFLDGRSGNAVATRRHQRYRHGGNRLTASQLAVDAKTCQTSTAGVFNVVDGHVLLHVERHLLHVDAVWKCCAAGRASPLAPSPPGAIPADRQITAMATRGRVAPSPTPTPPAAAASRRPLDHRRRCQNNHGRALRVPGEGLVNAGDVGCSFKQYNDPPPSPTLHTPHAELSQLRKHIYKSNANAKASQSETRPLSRSTSSRTASTVGSAS